MYVCKYAWLNTWKITQNWDYASVQVSSMQVYKYANFHMYIHTSMQENKYVSIQVCKYASMQVFKYASLQVCKYAGMQVSK